MSILRKYGVQTTFNFTLFEVDGIDFRVDAAHASGDTKVMKDEGAEGNTTNGFTDEGQGYSIVLTATEMQAARIVVYVVDQSTKAWLDTSIVIETYGNASAMHAFDLDSNNVLASNTIAERTQAKPSATPTAEAILSYFYMEYIRNQVVVSTTAGEKQVFLDDATTIAYKKTLTDASNVLTLGEAVTGP
jgi:hypothetical protein